MKAILSRLLYGKPIIVVSGLPRSGTSMLMLMLKEAGLTIVSDHTRTADEDNPRGYHELERVKELDKTKEKSWLKHHRGEVIKIISFLLQDLPHNLNYKVIFMRRNLDEVLRSQNRMLERNGKSITGASDEKMRMNYDLHLRKVTYRLDRAPNVQVLYLDYPNVVANPRGAAERISEFLGGGLDVDKMAGAVDAGLYRNRHAKDVHEK
jgi:hypothetical protein